MSGKLGPEKAHHPARERRAPCQGRAKDPLVDPVTNLVVVVPGAHLVTVVMRLGAGDASGEQGRGGDCNGKHDLHGKLLFSDS